MKPNYATIITPIVPARVDALRRYLRDHVEPRFGGASNLVQCQPLFRFDRINGLHFCSFVVLEGDADFGPCLVFETTFDGPRADFLRDLWHVAPEGMHAVYGNCVGYPQSGLDVPELLEEYLSRHDVGAQTFFSGCPGRSVAQIQGESQIRADAATFVSRRCGTADANPSTLATLQQWIQRDFVRSRPENRWVEQPAVVPWEMARRDWVARAAVLAALTVACALGAVVVHALFDMGPFALGDWIKQVFYRTWQAGRDLTEAGSLGWLGKLISELQLPILPMIILFVVFWLLVRILELFVSAWTENPRAQYFILRFPLHIAVVLKYMLPIFLVGFVTLGIVSEGPPNAPGRSAQPSQINSVVEKLDQKLTIADRRTGSDAAPAPALFASFILLLVVGFAWAVLHYWATSLKLAVQFQILKPMEENWRLFLLDGLRFAMVVAGVLAVLIVARHLPASVVALLSSFASLLTYVVLVVAAYIFVGILAFYAVAFFLFFVVRTLELVDLRRFKNAKELSAQHLNNAHVYAREEGGNNRYQNHLASLTYVKPGLLRRWFLRVTLFVVNLLSRFWFNRGDLGGIPTILSARWVLIDRGRRLLFLDNYSGAWNSYLNEFIDMGAVKGLNAIWSNTFVKTAKPEHYAYPDSRFYFWQGAQAEQPFKSYVRQSQIETIVWYSAYPTLSISNINMNTDLRQSLFKQLASCDLDSIVHRL